MKKIILGLTILIVFTACSPQPKTFDDCILKYMPGTQERAAGNAIYTACLNKFPEKK